MSSNIFASLKATHQFGVQDHVAPSALSYSQEMTNYMDLIKTLARNVSDAQCETVEIRDRIRNAKDEKQKRILRRRLRFNRHRTDRLQEKLSVAQQLLNESEADQDDEAQPGQAKRMA